MRRFYASTEQFQNAAVWLNVEETRHLRDVLRLKEGGKAQVFDGAGREFLCVIQSIGRNEARLEIVEEITPSAAESPLNLTLAVALLKGEKFDLVVQKAVELGVGELVPLNTKRSDVKLKDAAKKVERWRKIALEACKQSGRAKLMRIENPVDFGEYIETAAGAKILFAECGGARFSAIEKSAQMTAVVGAEGGWESAEIEAARKNNFQIITFGGRILRAETAAITVAAILQNQFGDLN
ncbi:MAG: 16S rRNA (uracil(1498)-N(3))-methyltransferase [Acidobacteriota bacterium]|nr:16S rRNA (uracil(1498)-N(3))-methyltransferase [Acidobacteriota bacterium]